MGLSEAKNLAHDLSHALAELSVGLGSGIEVGKVLLAEVLVLVDNNLNDFVGSTGESENVLGEVLNNGVDGAVVSLVEAEANDLEQKLVGAALLLEVVGDLVEGAEGLEELSDLSALDESEELTEVLVGSLSQAVL